MVDQEPAHIKLAELDDGGEGGRFIAVRSLALTPPPASKPLDHRMASQSQDDDVGGADEMEVGSPTDEVAAAAARLQIHRQQEELKRAVLSEESSGAGLRLEVRPAQLVPDTNAFIDHLGLLERLLEPGSAYTVGVPTVVVNELRGLAMGQTDEEWVGRQARAAINLLTETSARQEAPNVKRKLEVITSQGNKVGSIAFTHEEPSMTKDKNDDRILSSCNAFIPDTTPERRDLKREGVKLERTVVLLTEDRALRIKAILAHVPTKTPSDFRRWAGI